MKKSLLLYLIVFHLLSLFAQSKDIHKHSIYYPHSRLLQVRYEYYYDHWSEQEIKHGRYSVWYKTGVLQQECMYEEGKLVGEQKIFGESGTLQKVMFWRKGKKEKEGFFYDNGGLKKEVFYDIKGNIESKIAYYPNGKYKYKITYSAGKKPVKQKFKADEEVSPT